MGFSIEHVAEASAHNFPDSGAFFRDLIAGQLSIEEFRALSLRAIHSPVDALSVPGLPDYVREAVEEERAHNPNRERHPLIAPLTSRITREMLEQSRQSTRSANGIVLSPRDLHLERAEAGYNGDGDTMSDVPEVSDDDDEVQITRVEGPEVTITMYEPPNHN